MRRGQSLAVLMALLLALAVGGCGTTTSPPATSAPEPTDLPSPTVEPTLEVLPTEAPACPEALHPDPPPRPEGLEAYTEVLAGYLSAGATVDELEGTLREWGALEREGTVVQTAELTGGDPAEIVVLAANPESALAVAEAELAVFRCRAGVVEPALSAMSVGGGMGLGYSLLGIQDLNANGVDELAYVSRSCGAHTCFERLFLMEWDGGAFVNLIPAFEEVPYPEFDLLAGQVLAHVGTVASVGAGMQRTHTEIWTWDGAAFVLSEVQLDPPVVRIHYLYDGDAALEAGNTLTALMNYTQAVADTSLPTGLFLDDALAEEVLVAFTRFRLMTVYLARSEPENATGQLERLRDSFPAGSPAHVYTQMAEALWDVHQAGGDLDAACAAAIDVAVAQPEAVSQLYAGYANTNYEVPEDLCLVP